MVDKKYKGIGEPNKYLVNQVFLSLSDEIMKKKKLIKNRNRDVIVSWIYTWSNQQNMSIHE